MINEPGVSPTVTADHKRNWFGGEERCIITPNELDMKLDPPSWIHSFKFELWSAYAHANCM